MHAQPSRRDGHLDDLDLELLLAEPDAHPVLAEHLYACEHCRARMMALTQDDDLRKYPPMSASSLPPVPVVPEPANTTGWRSMWFGVAALAAGVLGAVIVWPSAESPTDTFRPKGALVDLEVFITDGSEVRTASMDATAHPGDRIGFQVTPRQDGFLYIVGFDATGAYPCWPQDPSAAGQPVHATGVSQDIDAAIVLDDRLGTERIVAVLCEQPTSFADAVAAASAGGTASCVVDQAELHKVAR